MQSFHILAPRSGSKETHKHDSLNYLVTCWIPVIKKQFKKNKEAE